MPAVAAKTKRDDLLQEIFGVFREWPDLERKVFSQAHYQGQSPQAISRSLHLNVAEVRTILEQCDRRLHDSLRDFRKSDYGKPSPVQAETACPVAREQSLKVAHALASKLNHIPTNSLISV